MFFLLKKCIYHTLQWILQYCNSQFLTSLTFPYKPEFKDYKCCFGSRYTIFIIPFLMAITYYSYYNANVI